MKITLGQVMAVIQVIPEDFFDNYDIEVKQKYYWLDAYKKMKSEVDTIENLRLSIVEKHGGTKQENGAYIFEDNKGDLASREFAEALKVTTTVSPFEVELVVLDHPGNGTKPTTVQLKALEPFIVFPDDYAED